MIVGVVLNTWKLPYFKQALDKATLTYTKHEGPVYKTTLLRVTTDDPIRLQRMIKIANTMAADAQQSTKH